MRTGLVFLVAAAVISLAPPRARAQDLGQPFRRPEEQQPQQKPAPKLTKPPQIKKTVEPVYPPGALTEKVSADVTMTVDIDAEGKVSKVEVTKPVGQGFDEAAREAVMQYLFSPAEIDGKPAAIRIEYTLHFVPKVEAPDGGVPDAAPADAAPLPALERDLLLRALAQIDPAEARVIELKHLDGLTFTEIGVRLELSPNSAKTRYYRGLQAMRRFLAPSFRESAHG